MFIWNVSTTWWIWNASEPGALSAFLANSLLMCFPWLAFRITKKKLGTIAGYISLIAFWMCFEYIHLHDWGLSWPWLTLGNVFATHTEWIQWYEYTGTSGGSLWILLSNVFIFSLFAEYRNNGRSKTYFILMSCWLLLFIVPALLSNLKKIKKSSAVSGTNIVIVQPNIDPYEKISEGSFEAQLQKLISLSESRVDSSTALLVWPETALYTANGIEEDKMKENLMLNPLWDFLKQHPGLTLFTGVESYRVFNSKNTSSAKPMQEAGYYYESYNGAALLDSSGALGYYHKSMLVPGVETLPWFLRFIDRWFEKFGGTTAGYTKQKQRIPLTDVKHGYVIAPAICYESIYGEFMSKYIRNGANIICIITNDGWWGNTPGHKQHMNYARLRAIETRKWVVRSANTGISCFIDPYGYVINPQPWDEAVAIKSNITEENNQQTFFVKHGDILSKIITVISILFIVMHIGYWIRKKF
jgi:apolipoprotein N-acyltransferase